MFLELKEGVRSSSYDWNPYICFSEEDKEMYSTGLHRLISFDHFCMVKWRSSLFQNSWWQCATLYVSENFYLFYVALCHITLLAPLTGPVSPFGQLATISNLCGAMKSFKHQKCTFYFVCIYLSIVV